MADVKISGTIRTEFGKGASRRLRRQERVPGVVYGHGAEPLHVELPGYDLMMALKTSNVLIHLDIEGKKELVIPKAVQREAIRGFLVHVDLLTVERGEKVHVEVPLVTEGDLGPGQFILEHSLDTLPVEAEATHIPESFTISIEGLTGGDSVLAKDVKLPAGVTLDVEGDTTVLQVLAAQAEERGEDAEAGESAE
ncbi:50S ribosomal protein L25/general stress protein Ctc [Streptomyces sp. TRM70308]|uniref:50S ribosomal protein L25/general stress protein Ctc n=1 Tax=Streptomyces sp. TRM70308 TaxID=3131932 RepID=UPI003D092D99